MKLLNAAYWIDYLNINGNKQINKNPRTEYKYNFRQRRERRNINT